MYCTLFLMILSSILSSLAAPLPLPALAPMLEKRTSGKVCHPYLCCVSVGLQLTLTQATWFQDGLGACGQTSTSSQPVVAVSENIFNSGLCGKWVHIVTAAGASVEGQILDRCVACGSGDLGWYLPSSTS